MANYKRVYNRNTPQTQPMEAGQVINNAGGYVFKVTPWVRLDRFLKLGSENSTYYQNSQALTKENAQCVTECFKLDALRTATFIHDVSVSGRAPKNEHAIFALALGAVHPNLDARQFTYAVKNKVCRTGRDHFLWMFYCDMLGKGCGRGFKRALAEFYNTKNTDNLAYQMVKYRQREGYTHKRALERCNQGANTGVGVGLSNFEATKRANLYKWARGKEVYEVLPDIVEGHIAAMALEEKDSKRLVDLITTYKLPWEAIPTWAMTNKDVWEALIPTVGLTALIRNLGNMTACGALTSQNFKNVTKRLLNEEALDKARIHPFNVLQALAIYRSGKGLKGNKIWTPVRQVVDALDEAFYKCFKYADVTGKRILVALDVSGSMGSPIGSPTEEYDKKYRRKRQVPSVNPLTCREAAAAMCLVTLKTEDYVDVVGFTMGIRPPGTSYNFSTADSAIKPLDITPKKRLDDVVDLMARQNFGGTDCALPFIWALKEKKPYDAIIVWTDNETWGGSTHPKEAMLEYRRKMNLDTKLIVCAMTATEFSIADPNDGGMLDIVGLDSGVPALISDFIKS